MRSVLEHLDGDDAVLLMYVSDELPAGDREQVDQRLASEAELRGQLDRLRAAYAQLGEGLARLDAARTLPGSEAADVRRVGRALREWHARRLAAPSRDDAPGPTLRFPYWSYPLAAAAAVTLAFVTWWYNLPEPNHLSASDSIVLNSSPGLLDPRVQPGPTLTTGGIVSAEPLVTAEPIELLDADVVPQFASLNDARALSEISELEEQLRQLQALRETMQ